MSASLLFYLRCVNEMNEKKYKRKLELQEKLIARQSEQIEKLKDKVQKLELELEEKNRIINSIEPLRNELKQNISDIKEKKEEYQKLINDIRKMKGIIDTEVYKNRWWLIKFLMK